MTDEVRKPKLEVISIAKPAIPSKLDRFKVSDTVAGGVETLLTELPHHSISQAKDFVRLHPDEDAYWSVPFFFANVPIKGMKHDTLHLVEETLALTHIPKKVIRFRLALATKPFDVFFLCHVPSQNLDNLWNHTNLEACERAKTQWTQALSLKDTGIEKYDIKFAKHPDAFPAPKWPTQSLEELIEVTFTGRMIDSEDHPGLLRLIGDRQSVS
jgi:hypothetical protein